MPARRIKQLIIGCFVCGMLLSAPGWAERAGAPRQSIDIPAGDLQASLERLAKQTGIEFIYDSSQLKDLKAAAISGAYTPKDALLLLLAGTQLRLVEYPSGALLITAQDPGGLPAPGRGQTPGPAATAGPARPNPSENGDSSLEAIIVTGTHIRGEPLVGSALSIYTREDIDQSGSATLEQFARQMPENFAAVDSVANLNTNANLGIFPQGASSNIFGGAAFDLNGLGVGSTLTLLNGHRLAPGGFDGSFVDISQIPLSAIDHLEVLDDGASAIYGSDAIAGVVNIVTRKDFERAQTGVLYGGATEGGAGEYALSQLFGHSWGRGDVFLDYEYDNQGGLDAAQRSWIPDQLGPDSLIPENRRNSFFSAINQDIASATTLSADILYGVRDFKNNSPLGVADEVAAWQSSVGHSTESTATLTLSQGLIADWTADFTGDFSEIRQQSKLEDPALGEVGNQFVSNSRIIEGDVLSSGSLYALPGGEAKASLGGSYRLEAFNDSEQAFAAAVSTRLARHVASGYGEIRVPVMGGSFTLPGVRRLELSGAFRYDHYSEFGPTSNPKYGLLWEPVSGFDLRGTFGTSFQAPFLSQLASPITSSTALIPDSGAPGGRADVLEIGGGNGSLQSERSRSLTASLDVKPAMLKGFSGTATFFHVVLRDRIQAENVVSPALFSQPLLAPLLSLNPLLVEVQTYFNGPGFEGDNAGLGPGGVNAIFDNQLSNLYSTVESGVHLSAQYAWPTRFGEFALSASGTHLISERIEPAALDPWFDVKNTIGEPTSWRMRADLGWSKNGFMSRFGINYVSSYSNTLFAPSETIGSWTTADLFAGYDTGSRESIFLDNLKIGLSVQNVFDRRPPNLQIPTEDLLPGRSAIPFDGANASPVGRFILLQVTKRW